MRWNVFVAASLAAAVLLLTAGAPFWPALAGTGVLALWNLRQARR